jgi:hypothetical protein
MEAEAAGNRSAPLAGRGDSGKDPLAQQTPLELGQNAIMETINFSCVLRRSNCNLIWATRETSPAGCGKDRASKGPSRENVDLANLGERQVLFALDAVVKTLDIAGKEALAVASTCSIVTYRCCAHDTRH